MAVVGKDSQRRAEHRERGPTAPAPGPGRTRSSSPPACRARHRPASPTAARDASAPPVPRAQAVRALRRGVPRRGSRRRDDRPSRPPRRGHQPQGRQLPPQEPRPGPHPRPGNRRVRNRGGVRIQMPPEGQDSDAVDSWQACARDLVSGRSNANGTRLSGGSTAFAVPRWRYVMAHEREASPRGLHTPGSGWPGTLPRFRYWRLLLSRLRGTDANHREAIFLPGLRVRDWSLRTRPNAQQVLALSGLRQELGLGMDRVTR